eukprot:XP_001701706.1 predicted protein [Chlamydomonas reinhardtii]
MLPRPAGRAGPRNSRAPAVAFAGSAALLLALLVLFAKPAPAAASPASLTGGPAAVTSANQLDERAIWLTPGDLATAAASQRADPTQLQQLRDKLLSRQSDGQASAAPEASTNSSRSRRLLKQQQRQLAAAPQKPSSKAGNSTLVLSGDAAPSPTSVADLYFLAANALQVKSANPGTAVRFDVPSLPVVSAPTPSFTNSTTPATAGAGTDAAGGTFGAASSGDEDGLGSDVMTAVAALAASPSASVLHPSGASNDTYVGAVQNDTLDLVRLLLQVLRANPGSNVTVTLRDTGPPQPAYPSPAPSSPSTTTPTTSPPPPPSPAYPIVPLPPSSPAPAYPAYPGSSPPPPPPASQTPPADAASPPINSPPMPPPDGTDRSQPPPSSGPPDHGDNSPQPPPAYSGPHGSDDNTQPPPDGAAMPPSASEPPAISMPPPEYLMPPGAVAPPDAPQQSPEAWSPPDAATPPEAAPQPPYAEGTPPAYPALTPSGPCCSAVTADPATAGHADPAHAGPWLSSRHAEPEHHHQQPQPSILPACIHALTAFGSGDASPPSPVPAILPQSPQPPVNDGTPPVDRSPAPPASSPPPAASSPPPAAAGDEDPELAAIRAQIQAILDRIASRRPNDTAGGAGGNFSPAYTSLNITRSLHQLQRRAAAIQGTTTGGSGLPARGDGEVTDRVAVLPTEQQQSGAAGRRHHLRRLLRGV